MVLSNIEVVRLSGQRMLLQEDLNRAADLLMHDGCLLIKGATDLSSLEPILEARYSQKGFTKASEHEGSLDIGSTLNAVERNIYLNRAIGAILFSAGDKYLITSYNPFISFSNIRYGMGRDPNAELYSSVPGLVVVTCVHLGGSVNVRWSFSVNGNSLGKGPVENSITVHANGGDIFVCLGWLARSPPLLENPSTAYSIDVTYCSESAPQGTIYAPLKTKILQMEEGRGECSFTGDGQNVMWEKEGFKQMEDLH